MTNDKMVMSDYFKQKRLLPNGLQGIVFSLIFDSGFKPIDRYPPYAFIVDFTSKNYKKDINGYGSLLEFDGITERLQIDPDLNSFILIEPNEKFTFACRFRYLSYFSGDTLFGRWSGGGHDETQVYVGTSGFAIYLKSSSTYFTHVLATFDTEWHTILWGFDGNTWFVDFDGNRIENSINLHDGFNATGSIVDVYGIGARYNGSQAANCQITELTLIKGASL